MPGQGRLDFDVLLHRLMEIGFGALLLYAVAGGVGAISGFCSVPDVHSTLRFLLAILIVTFARRTYWEIMEWRWGHLPPDERFGFANPLFEHPRSSEEQAAATGAQQTAG
jgi:hypothetical protein